MITIFTTPKPFIGHIKIIQENAITSWKMIIPECEIILLGNEYGTSEAAKMYGCKHVEHVTCNEYGTPLISALFFEAESLAANSVMCYANCDIMFTNTLIDAVRIVQNRKRYLLVGQRYNVEIDTYWDFSSLDWGAKLATYVMNNGELNPPRGIDYFIFPKGQIRGIPELAVGRAWWDNWMIYNARKNFIPLIDGTELILAVHQNHDYSHCKGGLQAAYYDGPEVQKNMSFVGNGEMLMTVADAVWIIHNGKIRIDLGRFGYHLCQLSKIVPCLKWPRKTIRRFLDIVKF
jgi:hypothetical protein